MTFSPESGLDSSIALRFDQGTSYGAVVWIRDTEIEIESSARLQPGHVAEFRLELVGEELAPYGLLMVSEVTPGSLEASPTIRGRFLRMEDHELAVLNAWLLQREASTPTGSAAARLDFGDLAHQTLQSPEAAPIRQRYQQLKGKLQPNPDILHGPFQTKSEPRAATDSVSVPSVTTEDPDFPPSPSSQKNQASGYLKSMSRRGKARDRRPTPPQQTLSTEAGSKTDWELPPPPKAALKKAEPTSEEWELPPPPKAALKKAEPTSEEWELPPPPKAALKKTEAPHRDLVTRIDSGTLSVEWSSTDGFREALDSLKEGQLVLPKLTETVERLSLVLPNQRRLALRIKTLESQENTTKVSFRINPVLCSKLDAALE